MATLLLAAAPSRARQTELPPELQLALMAKIMSFDRSLAQRGNGELRIVVLYQDRYPASRTLARELERAFAASNVQSIGERPLSIVLQPLTDEAALTAQLGSSRPGMLYVTPLRGADVDALIRDIGSTRTLTFTSTPGYVERGIAVGLELRGGKPLIRINLRAAKAQGADFSSQLLKLAEVLDR